MLVTCVPPELKEYLYHSPHQRLGLGEAVGVLQQLGEVVEASSDLGMVGAVGFLVDGQRAAHEGLGLGEAVGGLQQTGEVVEGDGDIRMVRTVGLLVDG